MYLYAYKPINLPEVLFLSFDNNTTLPSKVNDKRRKKKHKSYMKNEND